MVDHAFADLIGLKIESRGGGESVASLMIDDKHKNPNGVVHGAVLYAMADTGMGGALMSLLSEEFFCSTIEIKINYFRPAIEGPLRCQTKVIHKGTRTAAMESEIVSEAGKLLARATGTFMIAPRSELAR